MEPIRTLLSLALAVPLFTNAQWVDIPDPSVLGLGETNRCYFTNDLVGFGAIGGCRIARTVDGGQNWALAGDYDPGQANGILYAIDFDKTGTYGVAIGQNGFNTDLIGMVSHDGGQTWVDAPDLSNIGSVAYRVEVLGTDTFMVNYALSSWALSSDGGLSFTQDYLTGTFNLQFLDAQHGFRYTADPYGDIGYTNDGGQTWTAHDAPGVLTIYNKFSFADTLRGIAVQDRPDGPDILLRTTDGGLTWDSVLYSQTSTLDMAYTSLTPEGTGIVAIQNNDTLNVYLTDDFGATWTEHSPPETNVVAAQATTGHVFYLLGNGGPYNYWRYGGPVNQVAPYAAPPFWSYDMVNGTLNFPVQGLINLRVQDMTGRQLLNTRVQGGTTLPLHLPMGIYLVQAETNGIQAAERLFVR